MYIYDIYVHIDTEMYLIIIMERTKGKKRGRVKKPEREEVPKGLHLDKG